MLINEEVKTKVMSNTVKYYRDKGYECNVGDTIYVKTVDLPKGSNMKVRYICDKCGEIKTIQCCDYNRRHKEEKDFCKKCKYEKTRKTNLIKYGCENVMENEKVKEKLANTNIKKYGENCVFKCESIKDKIRKSMMNKYGCKSPIQNKDIAERTMKTNIERYGCPYPIVKYSSQEKREATNLERYGCKYSIASDVVKRKIRESYYKNGTVKTSSQQIYICNLYGAILNYPFDMCNVDMYFEKEKIYCEYDGGGHNVSIHYGKPKEYFINKERRRAYYLESIGLKEFRIISRKDRIPPDETLLNMKDFAFQKLLKEGYNWIKFDIDNRVVIYKDCQEPYEFNLTTCND